MCNDYCSDVVGEMVVVLVFGVIVFKDKSMWKNRFFFLYVLNIYLLFIDCWNNICRKF